MSSGSRWVRRTFFGVGLLALAYAGASYYMGRASTKPVVDRWKVEKLARGEIVVSISTIGTLNPTQVVWVGAQVSGKVKDVHKQINDPVKEGDLLALIDTDLLESERRSAEVRLSQAQASLALLKVDRISLNQKADRLKVSLKSREVAIDRARATSELADKNRQRFQDLFSADAASQGELDTRVLEEANSRRDVRSMEIELDLLRLDQAQVEIDVQQLDVKMDVAKADIDQAQAALERARTNLGYARLVAPIDGVVLDRAIEPGQTIAASFQAPNLFKIAADLTKLRIDARVDEADVGRLLAGQDATFEVDAYRGELFTCKLKKVKLQAEEKTNPVIYPVQFEADNPPTPERPMGKLLPGMTASLKVTINRRQNLLVLPGAALRFRPPEDANAPKPPGSATTDDDDTGTKKPGIRGTVYVADAAGVLTKKTVRVGDNDGERFELLSGELKDGDAIVVGMK